MRVELIASLNSSATIREMSSGANKVFRVLESENQSSIVKVYPVASRERRERHALEALVAAPSVPRIINHGLEGEMAWLKTTDGGHWNMANLPKNLDAVEASGVASRGIDTSGAEITNLAAGIDSDYVLSHYRSTVERLGRYRRRFGMEQVVLDKALELEPPLATAPVPAHTKPVLSKFVLDEEGNVTIVDWEWATLASFRVGSDPGRLAIGPQHRRGRGCFLPIRIRSRVAREPLPPLGRLSLSR